MREKREKDAKFQIEVTRANKNKEKKYREVERDDFADIYKRADNRWKRELKRDEVRDMIHHEKVRLAGIEAIGADLNKTENNVNYN